MELGTSHGSKADCAAPPLGGAYEILVLTDGLGILRL